VRTRLRQGYVAEENDVEVRVRIADATATLKVKAGRGLDLTEVEARRPSRRGGAVAAYRRAAQGEGPLSNARGLECR
jgi:hypothetical protein